MDFDWFVSVLVELAFVDAQDLVGWGRVQRVLPPKDTRVVNLPQAWKAFLNCQAIRPKTLYNSSGYKEWQPPLPPPPAPHAKSVTSPPACRLVLISQICW